MPALKINEAFVEFCKHPDANVTLTVKQEDEHKLFKKQYPMAESLKPAVREILLRWLSTGKIKKLLAALHLFVSNLHLYQQTSYQKF